MNQNIIGTMFDVHFYISSKSERVEALWDVSRSAKGRSPWSLRNWSLEIITRSVTDNLLLLAG